MAVRQRLVSARGFTCRATDAASAGRLHLRHRRVPVATVIILAG
jgi:hypothetical protein